MKLLETFLFHFLFLSLSYVFIITKFFCIVKTNFGIKFCAILTKVLLDKIRGGWYNGDLGRAWIVRAPLEIKEKRGYQSPFSHSLKFGFNGTAIKV